MHICREKIAPLWMHLEFPLWTNLNNRKIIYSEISLNVIHYCARLRIFGSICIRKPCVIFWTSLVVYAFMNCPRYELSWNDFELRNLIRVMYLIAGKTTCQACKKKCSGEVLRVQEKFFHIACFKCKGNDNVRKEMQKYDVDMTLLIPKWDDSLTVCASSLAHGGFFLHEGEYYCTSDYQQRWGTQCGACGRYVEGEVVTALGNTYHQACFTCARCRKPFPTGAKVTVAGREILCQKCVNVPAGETSSSAGGQPTSPVIQDNARKTITKIMRNM